MSGGLLNNIRVHDFQNLDVFLEIFSELNPERKSYVSGECITNPDYTTIQIDSLGEKVNINPVRECIEKLLESYNSKQNKNDDSKTALRTKEGFELKTISLTHFKYQHFLRNTVAEIDITSQILGQAYNETTKLKLILDERSEFEYKANNKKHEIPFIKYPFKNFNQNLDKLSKFRKL